MATKKRPLPTRLTSLLFAGTMGVFFTDPSSAQVGTTRGKLAKGDTEERSNKPVLANQAISGAGTTSKVNRNVVAPVEVPAEQTATAPSVKATKTEHVVVIGEVSKTGAEGNYVNKVDDLGPLGNKKLIDTPLSIMQVSEDVIKNQEVRNINDTLKYLPSVQIENRGAGGVGRPQSRGFEGDNIENSRADGLNIVATAPYPSEMFSKVTVLNGIAGAIYGPQTPAGTFDYTLKRPTENFFANFNMGADSGGAPLEHLDFGGRGFGKHAKWFGYRINLLNQQGESYTKGSHMRRDLVSGDFDIHLSKNTVLELDASQYSYAERGLPGLFSYDAPSDKNNGINTDDIMNHLPKAPDTHHAGYGQKSAGYNGSETMGQFKLKHRFNDNWKFKIGGMYEDIKRDSFWAANTLKGGDLYTQTIAQTKTVQGYHVWSNYAYLNGKFNTGSVFGQKITHHVNLGSNGYWLGNFNPVWTESVAVNGGHPMSLSDPRTFNVGQPRKGGNYRSATTRQQTIMLGDTIDIGKHLSIMGEISWAWIRTANYGGGKGGVENWYAHPDKKHVNTMAGPCSGDGYDCSKVTKFGRNNVKNKNGAFAPMVAIMYKFNPSLSTYFTWGESWAPGPLAPAGTSNESHVEPAQKSSEYEVGVKWAPTSKMLINVAAFSMERPYYYVGKNPAYKAGTGMKDSEKTIFTSGGNQHNYGVEAQISGKVTDRLSVLAGMTWLDAQVKNKLSPDLNNKQVVGVAPLQANILLDYRVPYIEGLAFNANVHYTGRRAADVGNKAFVGSYTLLDLGARYATKLYGHDYVMRFTVNNVTNESYWGSVFPKSQDGAAGTQASVMPGLPRTWSVTASTYW